MRTSLALFALTCSGCIFLYSEAEENAGGRDGQGGQGGQGGLGGQGTAQGASSQGGAGGTSGTGGAGGGPPVGCNAEKSPVVVAHFPVASGPTGTPTPIALGQTIGFVGSGSFIHRFGRSDAGASAVPVVDDLPAGGFDDLLLLGATEKLIVGHQAGAFNCDIAQPNGCDPTGSFLTGFVPWAGASPFTDGRFLALDKADGRVMVGSSTGDLTASSFGPMNDMATEGFDLAVNGDVIGITTYNPAMLWLGTLAQPALMGSDLPLLTPSHLVVRNDGSVVFQVGNTLQEKLMEKVGANSPMDFQPALFSPMTARSPLAYDPACDVLYAVVGLSPQQLHACVGASCAPVGDTCSQITGIAPAAPDDPEVGSVYYACVDSGDGTVMRWGPSPR